MPIPRWGADSDGRHAVYEQRRPHGRRIVSTVLRLIVDAAWSDDNSTFPTLLTFSSLGLLASLLAALNGFEIADSWWGV
jgi:hypothetical protein